MKVFSVFCIALLAVGALAQPRMGMGMGRAPSKGFLRSFATYTGVPMPEASPEFRHCFGRAGAEFRTELFSVADINDPEQARHVMVKAATRVSGPLSDCGATEMGSFFTLFADELQNNAVALVKDLMLIIKDAKAKNWDGVSRDLADALNYIIPMVKCDSEACHIFAGILRILQIEASDFSRCSAKIEDVIPAVKGLEKAFKDKDVHVIIRDLSRVLDDVTGALDECGIADAADVFNTQAAKIIRADIEVIDHVEHIIIQGLDITDDIYSIGEDIVAHNWVAIGADISKLVMDTRLSQCDEEWCQIAEGLLDAAAIVFRDLTKCEDGLKDAFDLFSRGQEAWEKKDYKHVIKFFGEGMTDLADAVTMCGIPQVAGVLTSTGQKIHSATVQTIGNDVKIITEGIDLFAAFGHFVEDMHAHDWSAAGQDLNRMVSDLSGIHCDSEFCSLLETVLNVLGIMLPDIPRCEADVADIKQNLTNAASLWREGQEKEALGKVADAFDEFANGITDCGLDKIGETIVAEVAKLRHDPEIVKKGDKVIHIIVDGADLVDAIYDVVMAVEVDDWNAIGRNLARLVVDLTKLGCDSQACKVFEGIIKTISDFYVDLAPCKAEIETAWTSFEMALKDMERHDFPDAMQNFEVAVLDTAHAVHKCKLDYIAADIVVVAELLHMAKVEKDAGTVVDYIVGGLSIIDDIHLIIEDYNHGDVQAVGRDVGDLIQQIRSLAHHGCENGDSKCLMVNAFLMGFHILPNLKECGGDFKESWNDILLAVHDVEHHHNKDAAVAIGESVHEFAAGLNACDVPEVVEILTKVGEALLGPEVAIIAEIIHILINGIDIADDVYDIYEDYVHENWLNMGIDLVRLIELLI